MQALFGQVLVSNGKRRYVDPAGHQNFFLLPAVGYQFFVVVLAELFCRPLSALSCALSVYQRVLVPLCTVADAGVPEHSR